MRIINDSDTVEFADGSGDKLVLLVAPRQRDLEASSDLETKAAMAQFAALKDFGVDTAKAMDAAEETDPDELAAATKAARASINADPKVRAYRLKALAVRLIVNGEAHGGGAIEDMYGKMDAASAAWVDEKVAEVWDTAIPSDADTRGQAPVAAVPDVPDATD